MYRELPRGCLNTYFTIECPEKKRPNLTEGHALYGCGHLIEAAAYVYCLEQVDNGCNLASLFVSPEAEISEAAPEESLPGTLPTLLVPGERLVQTTGTDDLYGNPAFRMENVTLKAIPYPCGATGSRERCWSGSTPGCNGKFTGFFSGRFCCNH